MPIDKDDRTEFFARLHEDLTEGPPDISTVRRSLVERGIDVDATVSKGLQLFADHGRRQRLRLAQRKLKQIQEAVRTWAGGSAESLGAFREDIARALAGDGGEVAYQAYHRKLESVDSEDLASLGEDAALLDFITRLEEDDAG